MSISVHQPERHTIFVAPSGCASGNTLPTAMMACGSADIDPCNFTCPQVKNTFLDIDGKQQQIFQDRRRSRSAPPSLNGGDVISPPNGDRCADLPAQSNELSSRPPGYSWAPSPGVSISSQSSWYQSSVSSVASGKSNFNSSSSAQSAGNAEVILSKGVVPVISTHGTLVGMQRLEHPGSESEVRLSPVVHVKMSGLSSLGSVGHIEGHCENRCAFHSIRSKTCANGPLCNRCHESHPYFNSRRRGRR
eukprot:gnl/TRDRNA2_/TRDRNA2_175559_c0_seq10.p1 gnl/TRDRNA2_/TRDRNA2_175559_c0~~gnl/TRDRNA2_/TRDRNA2_175559_c0_seq10.p1  ORF type:complete len:248 (+),score=23.39 gnl/TRDRNA2_/TRDRNA2_175559_c0_seq10:3-746(+)